MESINGLSVGLGYSPLADQFYQHGVMWGTTTAMNGLPADSEVRDAYLLRKLASVDGTHPIPIEAYVNTYKDAYTSAYASIKKYQLEAHDPSQVIEYSRALAQNGAHVLNTVSHKGSSFIITYTTPTPKFRSSEVLKMLVNRSEVV